MPRLVGFSRFAALPEDQISDKISRSILRRPRDDRPAVGTEPEKRSPKLHMQPILDHIAGVVRPALRKYLAAEKALRLRLSPRTPAPSAPRVRT